MSDETTNPDELELVPTDGPMSSQAEMEALRAQMFQQAVAECASQLSGFFPTKTDEELISAAARSLSTQTGPGMAQFMADAVNAESIAKYRGWGMRVRRKGSTDASLEGAVDVAVDTGEVRTMDDVNRWVAVLAVATSPVARAALDLFGYEMQLVRVKNAPGLVRVSG